jgi:molybdopterin-guanine dinucleotide biosynthesis protein A
MEHKLTGIILAGGKSRRMGKEKGLVDFKGQPLIDYSIKVLNELCSEIIISSNSKNYDHLGFKVVPDLYPDTGPMGGIYSCLKQSANALNLVLSCDMPFVTIGIFHHLLAKRGDSLVCVPWHENDHFEPLCGVYHHNILGEMEVYIKSKNYKLPDLFKSTSFVHVKISEIKPLLSNHYFFSINSRSDLELAGRIQRLDH